MSVSACVCVCVCVCAFVRVCVSCSWSPPAAAAELRLVGLPFVVCGLMKAYRMVLCEVKIVPR